MRYVMFSPQGKHYENGSSGEMTGIFVPNADQIRRLENLPDPNRRSVAERYGAGTRIPLWNSTVGGTWVFGTMDEALAERRHGLSVYLPQHFVPESCDVFYFVFGREWIVHGVRTVSDEGFVDWRVSKMQATEQSVMDELLGSISSRMLTGTQDQALIAVMGDDKLLADVKAVVEPLNLDVTRFSALSPQKATKPLYKHGDFGLMMLTVATFAALTLVAVSILFLLNTKEYNDLKNNVRKVQAQISRVQLNKNISVKAPRVVLAAIEKPYNFKVSDVASAVGEAISVFGEVSKVNVGHGAQDRFERRIGQQYVVDATVELKNVDAALLVAQEEVAQQILKTRPWIKRIERIDGGSTGPNATMTLKVTVQVR